MDTFPEAGNLILMFRKLLFFCHPDKDQTTIYSLLHLISATSTIETNYNPKQVTTGNLTDQSVQNKQELPAETGRIELSEEHLEAKGIRDNKSNEKNFVAFMARNASIDEKALNLWIDVMERIISLCLTYIGRVESSRFDCSKSDLQYMDTYLNIVNLFTSGKLLSSAIVMTSDSDVDLVPTLTKVADELSRRSISKSKAVFQSVSAFTSKVISRSLSEKKTSLLARYIQFTLRLLESTRACLDVSEGDNFSTLGQYKDSVEILISMLCIPALIYNLEKHSPHSIGSLNEHSIFRLCLKLLVAADQNLQKLTSTPALCLLANIIQFASLNEDVVASELISFVVLVTKLLESCQKNMNQLKKFDSSNMSGQKGKKKTHDSTDESYNHILGWLAREQAPTLDKDTSKLIKSQLAHLWSIKFLKILLNELVKLNEKHQTTIKQNNEAKAYSSSSRNKGQVISSARRLSDLDNQIICDNYGGSTSFATISVIKRAVERVTTTMTKTISSSYVKTTRSLNSSGSAKLMTEESTRISLVCFMLHSTLNTFRIIKQDILTGLCLHDYILRNLWAFISSLGPHNGLKAFLDHLAIHTKTNAPEFHMLILFCECTSHLISVLDDSELYEQQRPFSLGDLVNISAFLNIFVYRIITNNLVPCTLQEMDPILQTTHKLLTDLYKRDCRRKFAPQDHWLIKDIRMSIFLKDLEAGKPTTKLILTLLPHAIPHKERVLIFRKLVAKDKAQYCSGFSTFITIHRSRIVEDGYQQLARLPPNALKGLIRVKFINDHGLDEAGIDQDGVFKEFLEDTIKRVFDPALNLFCSTSEQRLYPSPTSRLHEDYLSLFNFVGKMLGKAIYEGIVVDVPFASFFLSRVLGQPQSPLYSPIDELPSLDPELYKSLTYIKHYEGDVSELDLTFSIDQDFMGRIETYELESGGKFIPVTKESRVRYIHSVANFRMKTQIEQQTEAFVRGFKSIIDLEWLSMFSTAEFQRLISGDESPIDLLDLRRHTKYFGGFHNNHRVICWLWDIIEKDFTSEEHRLFLKFVTSCSKPPLLGFANLEPPFSIRCVEVSDDQDLGDTVGSVLRGFLTIRRSDPVDRLPTSSTCFNLLKLPNYQRRNTLKEKLRYAIRSSPGFELS